MEEYEIYETLTYVYTVNADSEEQAEDMYYKGDVGKGRLTDGGVELDIYKKELRV